MGDSARGLLPVVGLMALGRALADLGVAVKVGDGVEAALDLLGAAELPWAAGAGNAA
jgi:hypothetical protein